MQGGRHEDEPQAGASRQDVSQQDEQEVGKSVALVDLIDHYVRHLVQSIPLGQHAQQHAVGAEHEAAVGTTPAKGSSRRL